MKSDKRTVSRRGCFTAGLRWAVMGLISVLSFRLLMREKTTSQSCIDPKGHVGCRGCGSLNECALPRALSFKQLIKKQNGKSKS